MKIIKKDPHKEKPGVYGTQAINKPAVEIWPNPYPNLQLTKIQSFPEFTCLCPRSGYPDFATVYIEIDPDQWVLEMKCLKLYLNSYRTKQISHEKVTGEIFNNIWKWVEPAYLKLHMKFTPRGNLKTNILIEKYKTETKPTKL